jgi:hypothetical protein
VFFREDERRKYLPRDFFVVPDDTMRSLLSGPGRESDIPELDRRHYCSYLFLSAVDARKSFPTNVPRFSGKCDVGIRGDYRRDVFLSEDFLSKLCARTAPLTVQQSEKHISEICLLSEG